MRRLTPAAALALLVACSPSAEPAEGPALSFSVDGGTYAWSVSKGAAGRLELGRDDAREAAPALVILCDDLRTGGLQTRLFKAEPSPTGLELSAGDAVMRAPGRPGRAGGVAVLEGPGSLPPDWAEALGAAGKLTLRYGDQGVEVQGPTPAQAAEFGAWCRELDARAG